ncbi:MAG: beta-N-acetylhexosaminidase [Deltaproteobacteria bacterium]|nr:beta-N-acetylhexosaminidase [Deltaproteobacteria bacterium]
MISDLRRLVGSLFHVGIPGPELDAALRATLADLQVGGVILFRRNVESREQLLRLTAAIHALPSRPLVSIDHEGGRVMRLGEPFTHFPPAAVVGHSGDPAMAEQVGSAMAAELASAGIDLCFAPVLDVHSNPANPVIGDRSFGSDPHVVAAFGVALMRGLLAGGVLCCGKHFPGHGDTATDSHFELPVVHKTRAELDQIELVPFRAAIAAGLPMVMSAHVVYPALDREQPSTLSRLILGDLLRRELGFAGVVASDDLDMRANTNHQPPGAAAIASLKAGVDLLLVCQNFDNATAAIAGVEAAVASGELALQRVEEAAGRIARLRNQPRPRPQACELPNLGHRALAERLRRLA